MCATVNGEPRVVRGSGVPSVTTIDPSGYGGRLAVDGARFSARTCSKMQQKGACKSIARLKQCWRWNVAISLSTGT